MQDLHNNIKISPCIDPAVIISGDATKTGATIDTADFGSLEFAIISGALTDGAYTVTVYESDDSGMSGEAAVGDADLIGTESGASFALANDSQVRKIGYKGNKRYVRIKVVQSSSATGGYLCAVAIQGHPKVAPQSTQAVG